MSKSRPINYALRPAKNIERKMMGEALARLSVIAPLSRYRYVGLGSEFFNDFSLYHQTLGIHDMVSIERENTKLDRCKFNRPYKCIEVVHGAVHDKLPQLPWKKRTIAWLDYTDALDTLILQDIAHVLTEAPSGSTLIVTVNVHPTGGDDDRDTKKENLPRLRLDKLIERVGKRRVPNDLTGGHLSAWGLAEVSHRIISSEVQVVLNNFNAPLRPEAKRQFRQMFHFRYRDGQRMLTVGGVVLDQKDAARLGPDAFDGLSFVRPGTDAFLIEPPMLTGREVRYLNQLLPHTATNTMVEPTWLSTEDKQAYREVYRYFPIFAESEL
jgi:hypothetical protein